MVKWENREKSKISLQMSVGLVFRGGSGHHLEGCGDLFSNENLIRQQVPLPFTPCCEIITGDKVALI